MSDLQCPAMVVLLAPGRMGGVVGRRALAGRRLAGVFIAAALAADRDAQAAAVRLAEAIGDTVTVLAGAVDGPSLRVAVDDLSDLHRGESIAVVASPEIIAAAVGRRAETPVVVAVDSAGWNVLAGPV